MSQVKSFVEKMRAQIAEHEEAKAQLTKLIALAEKYPDLHEHQDRWDTIRYSSSLINNATTDCELGASCGCCHDAPIQVWPYTEVDGFRIYAHPIPIVVGEKNPGDGGGSIAFPDWDKRLREAKIPETVIALVSQYFLIHAPEVEDDQASDNKPEGE